MVRYLYQGVEMEKSDLGVKSIDAIKREIMVDVDSEYNAQDPYKDGQELNLEKDFNWIIRKDKRKKIEIAWPSGLRR